MYFYFFQQFFEVKMLPSIDDRYMTAYEGPYYSNNMEKISQSLVIWRGDREIPGPM